jgi:hypothetical protein
VFDSFANSHSNQPKRFAISNLAALYSAFSIVYPFKNYRLRTCMCYLNEYAKAT